MVVIPKDRTSDELEERVNKYLKYYWIVDNATAIVIPLIFVPLFVGSILAASMGIRLTTLWQALIIFSGFFASLILFKWAGRKVAEYKVESSEWARYYTRSINNSLETHLQTESPGMRKEARKQALKKAKSFLDRIEKKWKVGSFEPVKQYVGDSISNLKKNIRWRVIPAIKDGDGKLVEKVSRIMYNFHFFSKNLSIENIEKLNDFMSKTEGTMLPNREPLKRGYLARVSMFLETHQILKHSFVVLGFALICIAFGYIGVTYFDIPKGYAWTASTALFAVLFGVHFSRQPKTEE